MRRPRLEHAILGGTRGEGDEQFVFREDAESILAPALDADLSAPEPADRLASIKTALRFASAFDGELRSPSAAARLRQVLRTDPRAVRILKENVLDERPIDRMRSFVRGEGREVVMKAPLFDQARRGGNQQ